MAAVSNVIGWLDTLRGSLFSLLKGVGPFRQILIHKPTRTSSRIVLGVLVALLAVQFFALPLFVFSPLILGVPHLLGDLRYLLLRRERPNAFWVFLGLVSLAVIATTFASARLSKDLSGVDAVLACIMFFGSAAFGFRKSKDGTAILLGLFVCSAFAGFALYSVRLFQWSLTHGHNLVALVVLLLFVRARRNYSRPADGKMQTSPVGPFIVSGVVLALAVAWLVGRDPLGTSTQRDVVMFGLSLADAARWMSPEYSWPVASRALGCFLLFQSLHYGAWIVWIADEDHAHQGSHSFRLSLRHLVRDLRPAGVVVAILGFVAVLLLAALVSPLFARDAYLGVATFHAYFELAILIYWISLGRERAQWLGRTRFECVAESPS